MKNQDFKSLVIQRQQFDQRRTNQSKLLLDNEDYFSLLCRNGPLPEKYHKNTDLFCLVTYLVFLVCMIFLVVINGISSQNLTYEKQDLLFTDIFYGPKYFLWQTIFSALGLMVLSFILTLLALYIPKVMSIFSILLLLAFCVFFSVVQFRRFFDQENRIFMYLFKALISLVIIVIIIIIIIRRKQKIMNLGLFLQLSSKVIRSHICKIYTQAILLSLLQIVVWYWFVNLYYGVATVKVIKSPAVNFFTKLIVVIMWLWTSGALIAFNDYFTISYTVHWFYDISKDDKLAQLNPSNCQWPGKQEQMPNINQPSDKYSSNVVQPVYKKSLSQIGTIIFGAILAYLPLYLISKVQKILFKSSSKQFGILTFSKYGYLDTVMEWQSFISANKRTFKLRKRIKSVMPELYMLGHIYGDFTKLGLILIGMAMIHQLVELKSDVAHHGKLLIPYTFTLILFGLGVGLQIVTNFTNLIGKCGDVTFYLYCIDLQIQRVYFSHNGNYSTPQVLWQILRQLTIKRNWKQQK